MKSLFDKLKSQTEELTSKFSKQESEQSVVPEQKFTEEELALFRPQGRYYEKLDAVLESQIVDELQEGEAWLSTLGVSEIKQLPEAREVAKELKWAMVTTSRRTLLVGWNKQLLFSQLEDISAVPLDVKDEVGRDTATAGEYVFLTNLSNDAHFRELVPVVNVEPNQRLGEYANLLLKGKSLNEAMIGYVENLFQKQFKLDQSPKTLFYKQMTPAMGKKGWTVPEGKEEIMATIVQNLVEAVDNPSKDLLEWTERWSVDLNVQLSLLDVIFEHCSKEVLPKLVDYHREVRQAYLAKEKEEEKQFAFDLRYAGHLKLAKGWEEATEVLEGIYDRLPDETIADLLPEKTLDLTQGEGGQRLKISVLEEIREAKGDPEIPHLDTALRLAELQPLVAERLSTLESVAEGNLKEKVQAVQQLFEVGALTKVPKPYEEKRYQPLSKDLMENALEHPVSKKEGGIYSTMQKWIAEVNIPDYSSVKAFSEAVTAQNYPVVANLVTDMAYALGMSGVQAYVARGENAIGLRGFEGSPAFILIGVEHLTEGSLHELTEQELAFTIGVEMAHLRFNHSRLTSNDVWRGAMDKGMFVVNTALSILPGIGAIGSSIAGISRLSRVANVLKRADAVADVAEKGVKVIDMAGGVTSLYQGKEAKSKEEEKEEKLLATSRLMEITADRAGLMFCCDLQSAVRSIFLNSQRFIADLPIAERYGLMEVLRRRNDQGEFVNQDLAIRISALFSFYLSGDYDWLVNG